MVDAMQVILENNKLARFAKVVVSSTPNSDNTRRTRYYCSEMPVSDSMSRIGAITPSRARINVVGSDREVEGIIVGIEFPMTGLNCLSAGPSGLTSQGSFI
jgi:hypothetical protein